MTDPQAVAAPRTEAGRALAHYWPLHPDPEIAREVMLDGIEAIEAEAFAPLGFRDDDGVWHPREAAAPAPSEPLRAALERLIEAGQDITPMAGLPDPGSGDWSRFSEAWHAARAALQASASEATPQPDNPYAKASREARAAAAEGTDAVER